MFGKPSKGNYYYRAFDNKLLISFQVRPELIKQKNKTSMISTFSAKQHYFTFWDFGSWKFLPGKEFFCRPQNEQNIKKTRGFKATRLHFGSLLRQGRRLGPRRSWRARTVAVGTLKMSKISRKRWALKQSGSISGPLLAMTSTRSNQVLGGRRRRPSAIMHDLSFLCKPFIFVYTKIKCLIWSI